MRATEWFVIFLALSGLLLSFHACLSAKRMKANWWILIFLALCGLFLSLRAYSLTPKVVVSRLDSVAIELNLRGLYVYTGVIVFACLGLCRGFGPVVYFPLFACLVSVTIVLSGVNAIAQLFFSAFIGLIVGMVVEWVRASQTKRTVHPEGEL